MFESSPLEVYRIMVSYANYVFAYVFGKTVEVEAQLFDEHCVSILPWILCKSKDEVEATLIHFRDKMKKSFIVDPGEAGEYEGIMKSFSKFTETNKIEDKDFFLILLGGLKLFRKQYDGAWIWIPKSVDPIIYLMESKIGKEDPEKCLLSKSEKWGTGHKLLTVTVGRCVSMQK